MATTTDDTIAALLWHGRERRALQKVELATQNRLRAYCMSLLAALDAQVPPLVDIQNGDGTSAADDVSQGDDQNGISLHVSSAPSWLNAPPQHWQGAKAAWVAGVQQVLTISPAAQVLLGYCQAMHLDVQFRAKQVEQAAKLLPIYPWAEAVRGVGALALGNIIAETGDLHHYATIRRLWKRLGLAVIDGARQRRISGDPALAIVHGYSPRRRAVVWNVAQGLIKGNLNPQTKENYRYRQIYLDRKALEVERHPELTPMHAHNRAARYMSKVFLKHLWQAWRDQEQSETQKSCCLPTPTHREVGTINTMAESVV